MKILRGSENTRSPFDHSPQASDGTGLRVTGHDCAPVSRSKGQRSRSITAETESVSYLPNRKACLRTSKLVRRWSMRYQLPRPATKVCEVGFLHAGGGIRTYRVGRTRRPQTHKLVDLYVYRIREKVIGDAEEHYLDKVKLINNTDNL